MSSSVVQCVAALCCSSVLQCIVVCSRILQCVMQMRLMKLYAYEQQCIAAVCCSSVLQQCVAAVCCSSVLQCVAVCSVGGTE